MKKLTKKSLDELASTMSIIPKSELNSMIGMYGNDCFWRCVSYLNTGAITESAAASYALDYWTSQMGGASISADYMLSTYGAGMSYSDARSYAQTHGLQRQIIFVEPSRISYYQSNGYNSVGSAGHAIVVSSAIRNSNGDTTGYNVYDPQNNLSFTIGLSESGQNNGTHWVY